MVVDDYFGSSWVGIENERVVFEGSCLTMSLLKVHLNGRTASSSPMVDPNLLNDLFQRGVIEILLPSPDVLYISDGLLCLIVSRYGNAKKGDVMTVMSALNSLTVDSLLKVD